MSAEVLQGGIRGAFLTLEDVIDAIHSLEEEGVLPEEITVFSPIPTPHLEEHIDRPVSKVRWMTLIGGIIGCVTGFALTYWTFFAWELHVGGKPISSFPVTVIIMFELTVLLGGLFTLAGVFIFSRIPALTSKPGYHPRFSEDLFGVFVHADDSAARERAQTVLDRMGAEAVEHAT
ncbi:DUF3341 domain-containing protein [soil metagenome]